MIAKATEAGAHIVPYDPAWPSQFDAERDALMTGRPGLTASKDAIAAVAALQYRYYPYRPDVMHWFCKPDVSFRTHHLHLIPYGSDLWKERIAFRDYLRANGMVAEEYARLKRHLAEVHRFDREAYTEAKGSFIGEVLRRASAPLATKK